MTATRFTHRGPHPTRAQTQEVWAWLAMLRRLRPNVAIVIGAYEAAEWTLGLTDVAPVTPASYPSGPRELLGDPDPAVLEAELAATIETLSGRRPGDKERASGAYAWLAWWEGHEDLPEWLVPQFERLAEVG
jgi:hypothetical protein